MLSLTDNSLENQRIILTNLNELLADSTQDLFEHKIKFEDAGLFEKQMFQVLLHNGSLLEITNGIKIKVRNKEKKAFDLTAIYSLGRLQIETFINLSYLFFLDCEIPSNIRINVYKVHGLRKQISLTKKHPKDFQPIVKLRNELANELKKIRSTKYYQESTHTNRHKLTYPNHAKLLKPEKVYELLEFGDLSILHSLYSNHIHSEYIGIRQLNSALNNSKELDKSISMVLQQCSFMSATLIKRLNTKFNLKNGAFIKASKGQRKIVDMLCEVSKLR